MDVLSTVVRELRLESAAYRFLQLSAPWRLRFDGDLRGVHLVVAGRCTLEVDGAGPISLETGDLVVLPRADSHDLFSPGGEAIPPISSLELARESSSNEIAAGGEGERTSVICGAFFFGERAHPAIDSLPHCIRVPARGGRSPGWLEGLAEAISAAAADGGAGTDVVMARLSEVLVIGALRHQAESGGEPGWLRGLHDPYVARALEALHTDLSRPWSLTALARASGLSRSAFASRFTSTVGQPPMRYVFRCRMRRAMTVLREQQATSAKVAGLVGYGSEAAFSAAFVRYTGTTPGAYRRLQTVRHP